MTDMKHLAELVGLSKSAVSLVLNGKGDGKVSKAKQELILATAREQNFRINRVASNLRQRKNNVIGVEMAMPDFMPSYAIRTGLIHKLLLEKGYHAVFAFHRTLDEVRESVQHLLDHNPAGIIAYHHVPEFEHIGIPVVLYGSQHPSFDSVRVNFNDYLEGIAKVAAEGHHRRVSLLLQSDANRKNLIQNFCRSHHLELIEHMQCPPEYGYLNNIYQNVMELLRRKAPPTLIFCSDFAAEAIYTAAHDLGISIPEELSVLGNDNLPQAELMRPALTTFDLNMKRTIACMIDLLLLRIQDPSRPVEHKVIETTFIRRNSTKGNPS